MTDLTVNGYTIIQRLASNGFAEMYHAQQKAAFDRDVAVKVFRPRSGKFADFIKQSEHEAQIMSRLQHPHILPLLDFWRDPDGAYLVTPLMRGGSLNARIQSGPMDLETTGEILHQIESALHAVHEAGIVHRNVKPLSIVFDEHDNAYLSDFELAVNVSKFVSGETATIEIIGTMAYLTPEQARGEQVTSRTDVYSLGHLLYEMLAGERPFANSNVYDVIYKHLNEPLPRITTLDRTFKRAVNRVIQTATAKNPAYRYASALEFVNAFRDAANI